MFHKNSMQLVILEASLLVMILGVLTVKSGKYHISCSAMGFRTFAMKIPHEPCGPSGSPSAMRGKGFIVFHGGKTTEQP